MSKAQQVTLLKDHTHAGKDYRAGATISVSEPERDWLLAQQIISAKPAASSPGTDQASTGGAK